VEPILAHYNELRKDIYSQPEDEGHTAWAEHGVKWMASKLNGISTVLDVGCGTGFLSNYFTKLGIQYTGITASEEDRKEAKKSNRNVSIGDMHSLQGNYDLVVARHVLEHSPFPILALMEWRKVANNYLFLVAPAPDFWGWAGMNHYSMANKEQLWWWLRRAGWKILDEEDFKNTNTEYTHNYSDNADRLKKGKPLIEVPGPPKVIEYRFLCHKSEPRIA